MSNNKVSQLPPTLGIKDPEVRQFLDALTNAWEMRSGNTNKDSPERFLTAGELIDGMASIRNSSSGNGGRPGSGVLPGGQSGSVSSAISDLESSIRQGVLYQILTTPLDLISLRPLRERIDQTISSIQSLDTGIRETNKSLTTSTESMTLQIDSAVSRIGQAEAAIINEASTRASMDQATTMVLSQAISRIQGAEAAIVQEQITRANADSATTSSLSAALSRIGSAESAISFEENTRTTKDNALASAINSIWASIGGNQAVIQDGQLAAVTPSAVSATRWSQVQAAAIDPATGQPTSAILRQEVVAYASQVDNKLNAIYSVRAQVSRNGQTVVGGFGLAAVGGAYGAVGPKISFGVTADEFFIAPPASSSDFIDAQLINSNTPTTFPFIALATPQTVGGVTYQPGVYMRKASIGDLSVDTLKIAGEAVIVPRFSEQVTYGLALSEGSWSGDVVSSVFTVSGLPPGSVATVSVIAVMQAYPTEVTATNLVTGIFANGALNTLIGSTYAGSGITVANVGSFSVGNGTHTASVRLSCQASPNGASYKPPSNFVTRIIVMTAKR